MLTDRMDKVNEQMKREISEMLQKEFQDARLTFVTITSVAVSRDLHYAKVMYSFLGDAKQLEQIKESLEKIRGYVRKLIGQRIKIHFTPEIQFIHDKSLEYSARIEQTLQEIKEQKQDQA